MTKQFILTISTLCFFISCKKDNPSNTEQSTAKSSYAITPFSPSEAFTDATLTDMSYQNGVFDFNVTGDLYALGLQTPDAPQKMCANSAKGQHIHLIVDNEPYAAKYVANFDHEVADGNHNLLAFLSRSYHESIKSSHAHIAQNVDVKNGTIVNASNIETPMLFYSRPKGTYVGKDTEKVMLDFFLVNCDLGDNYFINAQINDQTFEITQWQPYYVEGLPMGENTIELTLVDAEGNKVDVPNNPVKRTFTLKPELGEKN